MNDLYECYVSVMPRLPLDPFFRDFKEVMPETDVERQPLGH